MRDYFKEVGEMYHRKAFELVRGHQKESYEDPLDGVGISNVPPEIYLRAGLVNWLFRRDLKIKGEPDKLVILAATTFFREYLAGDLDINVVFPMVRYEMASTLYSNFEKICSALENDGAFPNYSPKCYAVCLHQLMIEIEIEMPVPKEARGNAGSTINMVNPLKRERDIASDIRDEFQPDTEGIICIPRSRWKKIFKNNNDNTYPDPKTVKKYKENIEKSFRSYFGKEVKIKITK